MVEKRYATENTVSQEKGVGLLLIVFPRSVQTIHFNRRKYRPATDPE
jgi:hypothetical protein